MFSCKKLGLAIFVMLFSSQLFAQDAAIELTHLLQQFTTFQASFTQTVKDKTAKTLQQSQGKIFLARPNNFRWEVTSPNHQIIIAHDNRLWNFDADLAQVTIQKISKANQQTPIFLLSNGDIHLDENFVVKSLPAIAQLANSKNFILTPKNKDAMFASIKLFFVANNLQAMELNDPLGHTTKITFTQVKMGEKLAPSLFIFKSTPGTDVIDETK